MSKIRFLPRANLYAYANNEIVYKEPQFSKCSIVKATEEPRKPKKNFTIGKQYNLKGTTCDGFDMVTNSYELVTIIDNFNGVEMNSVVMKPISVDNNMSFFSLTRQDCNDLGIEYQDHLQLFSQALNWEINEDNLPHPKETKPTFVYDPTKPFNPNDLSTYPVNEKTNTVMHMVIRLTGFIVPLGQPSVIITPYKTQIPITDFFQSLTIMFNGELNPMPYENVKGKHLPFRIVTNAINKTRILNPFSLDGSVFLEVELAQKDMSTDEMIGISPEFLHEKNINNLLVISWIEPTSLNHNILY